MPAKKKKIAIIEKTHTRRAAKKTVRNPAPAALPKAAEITALQTPPRQSRPGEPIE